MAEDSRPVVLTGFLPPLRDIGFLFPTFDIEFEGIGKELR